MKKKNKHITHPKKKTPSHVRAGRLIRAQRARSREKARRSQKHIEEECIFSGTAHGYGFAETQSGESVFLPAARTGGALDGDRIMIAHWASSIAGKREGEVLQVLEREAYRLTGILQEERIRGVRRGRRYFVVPDSTRLPASIEVEDPGPAASGDKVLLLWPRGGKEEPYIEESFGAADSFGANYGAILAAAGIETDFSHDALREAEALASAPLSENGRVRQEGYIFTVDGEGAKDLDDAISLQKTPNGYTLGVHIADVSEYVTPHTALDRTAFCRGTSVYFTDKVVPMLPPALSNGACSLNAGEDKYALTAKIEFNEQGDRLSVRIEKSIIRSSVRGVYSEVNDLFAHGKSSAFYEKYRAVYPSLCEMRKLYLLLEQKAEQRGSIEFEGAEAEIRLDESGMPVAILPRERGEAEKMIEQFMLAANCAVAEQMHAQGIPCVYRVHDAPPPDKLPGFFVYAHNLGLETGAISAKKKLAAQDFAKLLKKAEEKGVGSALEYPLLRTLAKAKYSARPAPHFGLSFPLYCHFTSPIRRLSDLATHRILKAVLMGKESAQKYGKYAERSAVAATEAELRAITAERQIEALYKTLYLSAHIGEEHEGRISSVTPFGMFAQLSNTCEGLIPLEEMPGLFVYDEARLALSCGELCYRIADTVRIRIEEADIPRRRCRFSLVL